MTRLTSGLAVILAMLLASTAQAAVEYDQDVTNEVIFGSGNANGSFTTDRQNGIELGLRAKIRFDSSNLPQNTFNSNGDGTYTFNDGLPPTGFGFAPNSPSTATWNFEFSVNSNYDGGGNFLDQYTYEIGIDFDPSSATNYLTFDPINPSPPVTFYDHAIGDNSTGNGGGTSAGDEATYLALIAANNLAQNSWNMEFFDDPPTFPFNGAITGEYDFYLAAFDANGDEVARTSIVVQVVPEPSSMVLLGIGFAGLAGYGWRRRKQRQSAA